MKGFKKVLFPVDLSEVSQKIVPFVAIVAKKFKSEIHLLFVARKFGYYSDVYVEAGNIRDFESELVKGAEIKIDEFAKTYLKEYPDCKSKVILGDAVEEILAYIKDERIDLVIMGTHGRKGLDRILFGSVAERVIKMSPVPVMSVNPYRISIS